MTINSVYISLVQFKIQSVKLGLLAKIWSSLRSLGNGKSVKSYVPKCQSHCVTVNVLDMYIYV